ncbi:anthranilate synthase component I family protein [Pseudoblastomonas halimionae]|uniref:Anthranilate synthase component I n=1 Tax=Alteriqipengyuania halimionae TaxID=1926630 RepID=A0A6I4U0H6_9SPHN|nr:chorismate-binding protein [Alteriqipengyuania halimionae]MXP09529.1 anthranilate synthase component I [Alteriqipengyuania halimionae]
MALLGESEALEALNLGDPAFVWRTLVADEITPVGAAARLIEPERGDFLLESVEGGAHRGRYSLLGLDPDLVLRADGTSTTINRRWTEDRDAFEQVEAAPLDALRALLEEIRADIPSALPPAIATLVGYFAYESFGWIEPVRRPDRDALGTPDLFFVRPRCLLVFDNVGDTLFAIAPLYPSDTDPAEQIADAEARLGNTIAALDRPRAWTAKRPDGAIAIRHSIDPGEYTARVARAKDYISAGDIFQVVLAQRFSTDFTLEPFALYRALRRVNPSPFLFHLDLPGFALVGSSPEILVRLRDGEVAIRPIAGTRPRGKSEAEDRALEAELRADPKECAEHLMLLDLARNDVGRVAKPGTVTVTESYGCERYSHVMHLVSHVTGELDLSRADPLDALFAGFPAGTVSGAPKIRACQIITELEDEQRGAYAGAVGYFAPDGSFDSCITLRTAIVKDGQMHVTAGAGIVADSDPASEQRECEAKAGALFAAAREAYRVAGEPE